MIRRLALALLLPMLGWAQHRAQIAGIVRDSSGGVIQDATVSLLSTETGVRRAARTTGAGIYFVNSLSAGEYKATVRKEGFRTVVRSGIRLDPAQAARLDILLEVGPAQEVVTIYGDANPMNTHDATSLLVLGRDPLENLPLNGSALQSLITLAPGVTQTPATGGEAGQFSANGQRPNTNYFTVDGVSANNGVSGGGLPGQFSGSTLPGLTAIGSLHALATGLETQELRIQTSTFSPEFGRQPGAQIAVLTRSGSNQIHGDVFGGFRHESLRSTDWLANRSGLDSPASRLFNAATSIGGPIIANHTFFFASAESLHMRDAMVWRMVVPSEQARESGNALLRAYPRPNGPALSDLLAEHTARTSWPASMFTGSLRVDHALGSRGNMFLRYKQTPSSNRFGYLQVADADFNSRTLTGSAIFSLNAETTNDIRVNISKATAQSSWAPLSPDGAEPADLSTYLPGLPNNNVARLYGVAIQGLGSLLSSNGGNTRQSQWAIANTTAHIRNNHEFRFGIDYQRVTPARDQAITAVIATYAGIPELLASTPEHIQFTEAGSGSSLLETFSVFAQDTWQATPTLNVTYGLRWDLTPAPTYRGSYAGSQNSESMPGIVPPPGTPGFRVQISADPLWKTRYTQFAPRVGVAKRVGDQMVIRAGAGVFYDLAFASITDMLNGAPYNRWRTIALGPAFINTENTEVLHGFAPNLRLPYSVQWNLTAERRIPGSWVGSVGYVGSLGRRLLRREGTIPPEPLPRTIVATNNGRSNFHSLQLHARRSVARGLRGTVSYMWSRAMDNGSWDSAAFLIGPGVDSRALTTASFDVAHSLQLGLVYDLPFRKPLLSGWSLSSSVRARSGFPIDVVNTENAFGIGFDNFPRPDLVPGVPVWLRDSSVPGGRRLNPAAFRIADTGQHGNLARNAIRGFGLSQIDLAAQRTFQMETWNVRFRAECYNITNRANFGDPVRYLNNALYGQSATTANLMLGLGRPNMGLTPGFQPGGPRTLQLSIGLNF